MRDASAIKAELTRKLPEWLARKEELLKTEPLRWLREFNPSTEDRVPMKLASARFIFASEWYAHAYAASGLDGPPRGELLALAMRAAMNGFLLKIPLYDFFPENPGRYDIDRFGFLLAGLLTAGWRDEAELVARQGFKELNRLMDRGVTRSRMPWFMLELAKDWLGANVSLDSEFRQSEVKNLGPWDKLLADWRNPDPHAFDARLSELATHHLAHARSSMNDSDWFEVDSMSYWLFPVELLAVLRIREWAHLPTIRPSHPLFSATPLGQLHPPVAWPHDEVMDQAEARFRTIYPATPSVTDVMALREEQGSRETPVR